MSEERKQMPQLDGLRALAMLGVIYHHWLPQSWRFHFPTEAGLFLFFVLSGFLMAQGLLCEREHLPKITILKRFHVKRLRRIYPAYYTALLLALVLGVREVWEHPLWWLANGQNFLILDLGYWPPSVSHFWTLAVEQQYYLVWPLVLLFVPRRCLGFVLVLLCLCSPLVRYHSDAGGWLSMDLIPWGLLDDFALGSLLALLMHRGMVFPRCWMDSLGVMALVGYAFLYISWEMNQAVPLWCHLQQTLLAVVFMVVISRAAVGRWGVVSGILENRWLVKLGQVSYGIYLFHNIAPLVVGKMFWFLWDERIPESLALILRLPFFAGTTWLLAWLCHRYVERRFTKRGGLNHASASIGNN